MSSRKSISVTDIINENNQYTKKNRAFFAWMPVNIVLLSFIIRDIWKRERSNTLIVILEHVIASILSLNILYLCCQRFLVQFFRKQYNISEREYNALQSLNNQLNQPKLNINVVPEQSFHQAVAKEKISFEYFRAPSPMFSSTSSLVNSEYLNDSTKSEKLSGRYYSAPTSIFANTSIISDSSFENSFPNASGLSGIYDIGNHPNLSRSFSKDDFNGIDNTRKSFDGTEYSRQIHSMNESSDINEYWKSKESFYRNQSTSGSEIMLNGVYQLSPMTSLESVKPVNEISSLGANPSICKKFGIHPTFLNEWIANFRMWITQTILTRVINEIKDVNIVLPLHGVTNISIGSSGIETLKKAATMSHVAVNIPSLSSLISFLDVSTNQDYVVQRITALSTGSMSNYCWNSGGTYEGKPWDETLPTDAALVMHLIAAYFDSQLRPVPHSAPDGRQFSSAHYTKTPAVPSKSEKSLIIYQQRINPPHFQLIIDENIYDISRGRNNLFHTFLFFLQYIKTKESGMFEHVNLGSSGINVLWIINEPANNLYKSSVL